MKTGIVILNYNNVTDTVNCIESIQKYNTASIKIVVVDNGSPNEEVVPQISNYIKSHFDVNGFLITEEGKDIDNSLPFITYFISRINTGYADGNNKGLKLLYEDRDVDKVMILNNDILFIEDIIPKLIEQLYSLPQAAIVSPLLLKKDETSIDYNCARTAVSLKELTKSTFFFATGFGGLSNKHKILIQNPQALNKNVLEIELPSGSCMLADKNYFQSIGGFDSQTFLYYEENILFEKIKKTGRKNYLCTKLRCIHLGASTTKQRALTYPFIKRTSSSIRYYVRNYAQGTWLQKQLFFFVHNIYLFRKYLSWNFKYKRAE